MKLLYLVESGESKFLVFDEMPDKISTKYGDDTIIGRIGGIFYDFLAKRNERREAFGGRKFDIVLDNGEIEKCEGLCRQCTGAPSFGTVWWRTSPATSGV